MNKKLIIFMISLVPFNSFGAWTDPVLVSGSTPIKAVHINELRTQLNTKLAACGLTPPAWTDSPLLSQVTPIKKVHLDELRSATTNLVSAYRSRSHSSTITPGTSSLTFTDSTLVANTTVIKAAHINELRAYVDGGSCAPAGLLNPGSCTTNTFSGACSATGNSCTANVVSTGSSVTITMTSNFGYSCTLTLTPASIPYGGWNACMGITSGLANSLAIHPMGPPPWSGGPGTGGCVW